MIKRLISLLRDALSALKKGNDPVRIKEDIEEAMKMLENEDK